MSLRPRTHNSTHTVAHTHTAHTEHTPARHAQKQKSVFFSRWLDRISIRIRGAAFSPAISPKQFRVQSLFWGFPGMVILFCPKSRCGRPFLPAIPEWSSLAMIYPRVSKIHPTDDPDGKEGKDARTGMFVQETMTNQGKPRRFSHEH